jgi:hypothetical protein
MRTVTIELEIGEESGAVVGFLQAGIGYVEPTMKMLPPEQTERARNAVRLAREFIKKIESQVMPD